MNGGFEVGLSFHLRINGIRRSHLSLSGYEPESLVAKDLQIRQHMPEGRLKPEEHLARLAASGQFSEQGQPLLLLSTRNVLSNLRCVGFVRKLTDTPVGVRGERFDSVRPFHILGATEDGQHFIDLWDGRQPVAPRVKWFVSGVPVLWDDETDERLLQRLVPEAADHSHIWHLARGNHPLATDATRAQFSALHECFKGTLTAGADTAFASLISYAERESLTREDSMLHNVVGVQSDGRLNQLIAVGCLEALGHRMRQYGCVRALCLDNSGSSVALFRPAGLPKAPAQFVQLAAAPNHRHAGTAYIVIELDRGDFSIVQDP